MPRGVESARPGMGDPFLISGAKTAAARDGFEAFVLRVRTEVEDRMGSWLDERVAEASTRGKDIGAVADAIRRLAMRGGKRMRPVLLAAAYEGCGGDGGSISVVHGGVALELFQAYLLTHDDWMDGDDLRRGGPSVPAMMKERFARTHADAMSVLAGDLAAAWARRALFETPLPPARVIRAAQELARVEDEVVQGQILDVAGASQSPAAVEAMHTLKTASYSVRGPVVMGARLAGASEDQVDALAAFAEPLGVAFQLRDDLLGVFGDTGATGKGVGGDLRKGKYSAVVVAGGPPSDRVARVFGRADASDDDMRSAIESLEASGARSLVEARIRDLAMTAHAALDGVRLIGRGRNLLVAAAHALTERPR